ncbi:hypothetical protein [Endozoicomonas sp. 2B-B]
MQQLWGEYSFLGSPNLFSLIRTLKLSLDAPGIIGIPHFAGRLLIRTPILGGNTLKLPENFDITSIVTLLGFISSLMIWGIKLERQVGDNSASVDAFEKVQEVRWNQAERSLETLRRDIIVIEEQLRNSQSNYH